MHRRYRLEIFNRGVTATTGTVAYTLSSSDFTTRAPIAGGFSVRAAEARVESLPWSVEILDRGSTFTAKIANSSGRLHLLGRMTRLKSSIDSTASTAYQTMAVGRLTDVQLSPGITAYTLTINDERWVERQTDVFTKANTAMLIPSGMISAFHNIPATPPAQWKVRVVTGNVVCLEFAPGNASSLPAPVAAKASNVIVNDVKPDSVGGHTGITVGNFTHCRFRNTGNTTDYEIATFDSVFSATGGTLKPIAPGQTFVEKFAQSVNVERPLYVWLVWTASQPSVGATVTGYVYAPTHPPTSDLPLHIGGTQGVAPFTLARQLYSGTYSGTTTLTVRYSTSRFATLEADQSFGRLWLRLTNPTPMADILDSIYGGYGVAPFTDSSGKIAPFPLRLPASTAITVSTLLTLGSSNIDVSGHPTWEHSAGEIVNAFTLSVPRYDVTFIGQLSAERYRTILLTAEIDSIKATTATVTRTHDNTTTLGRRDRAFTLPGTPIKQPLGTAPTSQANLRVVDELADVLAAQIFPRFGDGPIYSQTQAMRSVDLTTRGRILPGTFVKVALGTFPNPATLARGSTRIMQVVERWDTPIGPRFRLLDVGPNLAVLTAPAIALAQSTKDTRHAVIGTVTSIPSGAKYEAHLAITSTGSTAPATASTRWFPVVARGTSTFTRGFLPSKSKVWGRVRAFKPNRVGSAWSTNGSVVTASITVPTISGVSSITAGTATIKWANGSSRYPTEVMVDASTAATLGSSNRIATVKAGSTRYDLVGLNSNDSHKIGVRHADGYGGYSAQDTTTFTTTTGYTAAPSLKGLIVLQGG